jgi:hypothetical protein
MTAVRIPSKTRYLPPASPLPAIAFFALSAKLASFRDYLKLFIYVIVLFIFILQLFATFISFLVPYYTSPISTTRSLHNQKW